METGCDASLGWHRAERFRRVCPLLKRDAAGAWRCSVDTADVRPFWMRAALYYGSFAALVYFGGTLAFFGVQRALGKPITYAQVVWPPKWKEYPKVQSLYFAEKARVALEQRNVGEAVIALSLAYQLDPDNYGAGFKLAQLWQIGQPALADRIYNQLASTHPAQRAGTLTAWYQSLLLRGDFKAIVLLATDALKIDERHADAWMHALLFALRREPDPAALQRLVADAELPQSARAILALEHKVLTAPAAEARLALLEPAPAGAYPYFDYYRARRLTDLAFATDALRWLQQPATRLESRDKIALWLDAQATAGWTTEARNEALRLIEPAFNPHTVELISAHLVRHPDITLLRRVLELERQKPLLNQERSHSAYASLLCAAGAIGDHAAIAEVAAKLKQSSGSRRAIIDQAAAFFQGAPPQARIEPLLTALQPLPIDVTYALLERYYHSRSRETVAARTPQSP